MPSKAFKTAVLGLGAGVGLYYGSVGLQIAQIAREEIHLRHEAQSEEKAVQTGEKQQLVQVAAMGQLQEQLQIQQQDVKALEEELNVARQKVIELEDLRTTRVKTAAETEAALVQAGSKLERLVSEIKRHRESVVAAQQALGAAHIRIEETRLLTNPLNHPMLKGLLNK